MHEHFEFFSVVEYCILKDNTVTLVSSFAISVAKNILDSFSSYFYVC